MQPIKSIQSLENMCLQAIVDHYDQNGKRIALDKTIQNKLTPSLFLKLRNIQNECVSLKFYSWTNHYFCLGKVESFSLHTGIHVLISKLTKEIGFYFKSVLVDDLEWNAQFNSPMWQTASAHKCLNTYGFKPGEELTIFFEISGIVPGREPIKEMEARAKVN